MKNIYEFVLESNNNKLNLDFIKGDVELLEHDKDIILIKLDGDHENVKVVQSGSNISIIGENGLCDNNRKYFNGNIFGVNINIGNMSGKNIHISN